MQLSDVVSLLALVIAFMSLAIGSTISFRQARSARDANHIAVLVTQMNDFRERTFNEDHDYLCRSMGQHNSHNGISGLPEDVRQKFYNVVYFYQILGVLIMLKTLSRNDIITIYQRRVVELWNSLEPFVKSERRLNGDEHGDLLANFQAFAEAAMDFRPNSLRLLIDRNLRRRR